MRILYFDIDCLRPDHLGGYGYDRPTSPTIDRIAREGMRFENCYCASSPCLSSRTGLVSGRFGIRNGVISNHGAGARFAIDTRAYGGPREAEQMFPRLLNAHGIDPVCFSNFADRHAAMWFMCGWTAGWRSSSKSQTGGGIRFRGSCGKEGEDKHPCGLRQKRDLPENC